MRTKAQRRNTIAGWLISAILLTAGAGAGVGFWAFGENQLALETIDKVHATPDPMIPALVDENSLKIALPTRLDASADRPLWAMTRRPYTPPLQPAETEPAKEVVSEPPKKIPPLDAQLNSVILANELKMIFLNTKNGIIRLEPGMSYNGWKLDIINEDSAEFHFDEERKVLQLRAFATTAPKAIRALGGEKHEE